MKEPTVVICVELTRTAAMKLRAELDDVLNDKPEPEDLPLIGESTPGQLRFEKVRQALLKGKAMTWTDLKEATGLDSGQLHDALKRHSTCHHFVKVDGRWMLKDLAERAA